MRRLLVITAISMFFAAGPALAMSSSEPEKPAEAAELTQARKLVDGERYKEAVPLLEKVVAAEPSNADAWNLLAFSQRKVDDVQEALTNYKKALTIDPEHKDAHEYIGELYLRMGDLQNAELHLKKLDDICFFGCKQYDELKAAVAAFKSKKGS